MTIKIPIPARLDDVLENNLKKVRICPYCNDTYVPRYRVCTLNHYPDTTPVIQEKWCHVYNTCLSCEEQEIRLFQFMNYKEPSEFELEKIVSLRPEYPSSKNYQNTPSKLLDLYEKGCKLLSIDEEAAAARFRVCLEAILIEQSYVDGDLNKKINDACLKSERINTIGHMLRHFGNFGAHAMLDINTGKIIPVEEDEADFCKQSIEGFFEIYYEDPAKFDGIRVKLTHKLKAAGKSGAAKEVEDAA